jgi:3-oxoacyl-[acyl-carrier protein] reductase
MTFASLSGKRILVTGSSVGIGRAIVLECARAGADVVVNCRRSVDLAESVAVEARMLGVRVDVIAADVADEQDRRMLIRAAFDTGRIDALVNNAGADLLTTQLRNAEFSQKMNALLQTDVAGHNRVISNVRQTISGTGPWSDSEHWLGSVRPWYGG